MGREYALVTGSQVIRKLPGWQPHLGDHALVYGCGRLVENEVRYADEGPEGLRWHAVELECCIINSRSPLKTGEPSDLSDCSLGRFTQWRCVTLAERNINRPEMQR